MPEPNELGSEEAAAEPARHPPARDESIPIWSNLKWALIVLTATIGIWWIAGPIVRWLGIDELVP